MIKRTHKFLKISVRKIMLLAMAFCSPVPAHCITRISPFLAQIGKQTAEELKQPNAFAQAAIRNGIAKPRFNSTTFGKADVVTGGFASRVEGLAPRTGNTSSVGQSSSHQLFRDMGDIEKKLAAEFGDVSLTEQEWKMLKNKIDDTIEEGAARCRLPKKELNAAEEYEYWKKRSNISNLVFEIERERKNRERNKSVYLAAGVATVGLGMLLCLYLSGQDSQEQQVPRQAAGESSYHAHAAIEATIARKPPIPAQWQDKTVVMQERAHLIADLTKLNGTADADQKKSLWRELMRKWHPDKQAQGSDAAKRYNEYFTGPMQSFQ